VPGSRDAWSASLSRCHSPFWSATASVADATNAPDSARSPRFDDVTRLGVLRVGVLNAELLPFVAPAEGSGFEPDLVRAIAEHLFGELELVWVPVRGSQRFDALRGGEIDLLARVTTHTVNREGGAAPTSNYFLDGLGLSVSSEVSNSPSPRRSRRRDCVDAPPQPVNHGLSPPHRVRGCGVFPARGGSFGTSREVDTPIAFAPEL
jgi:general L-amino acid transport system substrate-binding protein